VIGLPGEEIQARDGIIAVNGTDVVVEQWLPESERRLGSAAAATVDIPQVRLDDDQVFVLGDNRDDSVDSRSFGPVDLDRVVGTVAYRFWPISRAGKVSWS
jgi:signal peptidase I